VITRNAAQCALCKDIIESKDRHDFVKCSCGEIFVDGGHSYFRGGTKNIENFISLLEENNERS
jgi:hypothetical protein